MSEEQKPGEKKIIIDEDWKSQVEAEKEQVRTPQGGTESPHGEPSANQTAQMPPPSLIFLAGGLYLQGVVALGMLPSPTSDEPEVNLDQAKYAIDTLDMLKQKTEGNRTTEETSEMDRMLYEMRMAYVAVRDKNPGGTEKTE